jgi:hypothetical protein
MDPRDPTSPLFYSIMSLLFSSHAPQYGLFVAPHNAPLSLSLPRVTIDSYQRNYLLTAIRTATKITNLATYTLSLVDSDRTNACILDELYTLSDSTPRNPYIPNWEGKKLYKLVRKAQRSVRFHLFKMRNYISLLEIENGVKYIRTVIGSAWQYRYLVDLLLARIDKCSYKSAYHEQNELLLHKDEGERGIDVLDPKTYGIYFNPEALAVNIGSYLGLIDENDVNFDEYKHIFSKAPSYESTRTKSMSSYSISSQSGSNRNLKSSRGLGMYVWIIVLVFIIGLFIFRAVNDVVVTVQNRKDD